jgi:hypothetical protein
MRNNTAGVASLCAAMTGLLALIGDVLSILGFFNGSNTASTVLQSVFMIADLAGLLLGLFAPRRTGFHLSWAPAVIVLLVLAVYRPRTAADIVNSLGTLVFDVFNGLADLITNVVA